MAFIATSSYRCEKPSVGECKGYLKGGIAKIVGLRYNCTVQLYHLGRIGD